MIHFMNRGTVATITKEQLESLKNIEYAKNKTLYYEIPFVVHCLNTYISDMIGGDGSPVEPTGMYDKRDQCFLSKECFCNGK